MLVCSCCCRCNDHQQERYLFVVCLALGDQLRIFQDQSPKGFWNTVTSKSCPSLQHGVYPVGWTCQSPHLRIQLFIINFQIYSLWLWKNHTDRSWASCPWEPYRWMRSSELNLKKGSAPPDIRLKRGCSPQQQELWHCAINYNLLGLRSVFRESQAFTILNKNAWILNTVLD